MPRLRLLIPPISILLVIALTLVGAYVVRKQALERAMVDAMKTGDEEMVRALLDSWPCPVNVVCIKDTRHGTWDLTPLVWAIDARREDLALLALARGADLNRRGENPWTPVCWAANNNEREVVRALLDRGADPNTAWGSVDKGGSYVWAMDFRMDNEVVALLLAKGLDPRRRDPDKRTLLHFVAMSGDCESARLLLSHGADVDAKDDRGRTPLNCAAFSDEAGMATLLISEGARVDARDDKGRTPLHRAAERFSKGACAVLIEKGADINAKDVDGKTPLALVRGRDPLTEQFTPSTKGLSIRRAIEERAISEDKHKDETIEFLLRHSAME